MKEYHVVAMNHVDMAFVMREEAHEEMLEITLERVISAMERHPEIHFALEQAAHYRKLENRRPDLFEKVKKLLAEGRMEFLGGMATTAETNFPNGECYVRNQGMGYLWVKNHLKAEPKVGWLVDTFGMNAQIPQIMSQFGFKHVYANRFGGDKRHDMFWDEGLDGSRILVIGKDLASVNVIPNSQAFKLCRNPADIDKLFADADALQGDIPKLVNYYIENEEIFSEYYLKLVEERNKGGNWKHSTYAEYSEDLEKHGYDVPTLNCDLNPEFTGTFALRTPLKVENRRMETELLEVELWESLLGTNVQEVKEKLEECWWDLFFCQFHDVFTGSHEDITFRNAMNKFHRIGTVSDDILRKTLFMKPDENRMVCCNALPWKRKEWVETPAGGFFAELLPCSIKEYDIEKIKNQTADVYCKGTEISNEYLKLVLSETKGISLLDRKGKVYLAEAADFLVAQADYGGLQIERCDAEEIYALSGNVKIGEVCTNEMGQTISMYGTFPTMPWNRGLNKLAWEIKFSLRKGEQTLRMKILLDWEGKETRIRLKVPGAIEGRDVFHEIPFGVIRRDAYRNLPTAKGEWPVARFAAIEDGKSGIALINRGVAGVEQEGRTLATTLIRAYGEKDYPWIRPSDLTSQYGRSEFDFMLIPYDGTYAEAGIIRKAQEFNQPFMVSSGSCNRSLTEKSWFSIDKENVVLSTIKRAWDDSGELIIRMYEAAGTAEECTVVMEGLQEAYRSDLMETKGETLVHEENRMTLEFAPFEIKTIRVKRN